MFGNIGTSNPMALGIKGMNEDPSTVSLHDFIGNPSLVRTSKLYSINKITVWLAWHRCPA